MNMNKFSPFPNCAAAAAVVFDRSGYFLHRFSAVCAIVFLASIGKVLAEPPGEKDHEELRAMLVTVSDAINSGDFDSLEPLLAENFVFTTSDQVSLTSLDEIRGHFAKIFESADSPVTGLNIAPTATIETQFVDDNNGFCYGTASETYTLKGGKDMEFTSSWTGTVTRVDGKWKMVAAHVGIHFFENPIVDVLQGTAKWSLIGGSLGGLLIGFLLGKMGGGKKAAA